MLAYSKKTDTPIVIATTGYSDEQKKKIISEIFRRLAVDVKGELKRAAGEGLESVKKAAGEGLEAAKNAITSLTRGEK